MDDKVNKAIEKLIKQYYILDEEIDILKIKNKILFIILALLVLLKIIGG